MSFKIGDRVRIIMGNFATQTGVITKIRPKLKQYFGYYRDDVATVRFDNSNATIRACWDFYFDRIELVINTDYKCHLCQIPCPHTDDKNYVCISCRITKELQ
jgi:hypothetical protein